MSTESPTPSASSTSSSPWTRYREAGPGTRARDLAATLGISEAALLADGVGRGVIRLAPQWKDLTDALPVVGAVKTMTRNDHVVLEHWGSFRDYEQPDDGGAHIDLRLFLRQWGSGFAVEEPGQTAPRRSLQFFDAQGDSIHKIYLEDEGKLAAWQGLVERFQAPEQTMPLPAPPAPAAERPDSEIDVAALRAGWDAMKDTHEFVMLLHQQKIGRTQALRLAGPERALKLSQSSLRIALEALSARELPFMIFVGNRGIMQIFTGRIRHVKVMGDWVNVLDRGFNLHAKETGLAETWLVRKPTSDGPVTSLELYGSAGETLALLFGERKPGDPELAPWRALMAELPPA